MALNLEIPYELDEEFPINVKFQFLRQLSLWMKETANGTTYA